MNCCFAIPLSSGFNAINTSLEGVMKSRNLGLGLAVFASSLFLLGGTASVAGAAPAVTNPTGTCVVHSLPSFVAQGENINQVNTEAMVADVIQVECNPTIYGTGSKIKLTASQLFTRCGGKVTWYVPNPYQELSDARGITVRLDADGNAT